MRITMLRLLLVSLFCASTPVFAAQPPWIELETDSFRALSQVKERKARAILRELQIFQTAIGSMTTVPAAPPKVRTQIFLLDQESFRFATEGFGDIAGMFVAHPFRNDILIDASRPTELSLYVIYHEYVHYHIRNNGHVGLPAFYEEGLAQIAQYFRVQDRHYEFAYFPPAMSKDARSSAMPLARLLTIETGSEEYRSHQYQAPFYARSLLLLHYCIIGNPSRQASLVRFVARRINGEPLESAFRDEFGMGTEAFDKELDAYLARGVTRFGTLRADSLPRAGPTRAMAIATEDANVEFADLLLRMRRQSEQLETWITPALGARRDHKMALTALACWHDRAGRTAEANALVDELVGLPAIDADSLARAGAVMLERAQRGDPSGDDALVRARSLFERALEQQPDHLEAAFGFGISSILAMDDLRKSLPAVQRAAGRFPESGELQLIHAIHLVETGSRQEALKLFAFAACRGIDPQLRALVSRELGTIACSRAE